MIRFTSVLGISMLLCLFSVRTAPALNQISPLMQDIPAELAAEGGAYRAVFAHFLAVRPNSDPSLTVDSALSVSNVCAAPEKVAPFIGRGPSSGRLTLFLYDRSGTLTVFETDSGAIGEGLNSDGTLAPGQTWTVRLAEVIAAAWGVDEADVEFLGYAWVLSQFDCLAGTYSNTIFGLGFTQSFELLPAMGQGGFFGGLMIPTP